MADLETEALKGISGQLAGLQFDRRARVVFDGRRFGVAFKLSKPIACFVRFAFQYQGHTDGVGSIHHLSVRISCNVEQAIIYRFKNEIL